MLGSHNAKVSEAESGVDAKSRSASGAKHFPVQPFILMLSSDDLSPQLSRMPEAGLSAYLVRPITRKELFEAISRAIEPAPAQRAP
jgi:DNA-binding NarL/FixJ family response regulator